MYTTDETNSQAYMRRRLTRIALGIRRSRIEGWSTKTPISVNDYEFVQDGRYFKRKKIVLAAAGCVVPTCTMCPIPNESFYRQHISVTPEDLIHQFVSSFQDTPIDSYQLISVYNSGNWFADKEIPPQVRQLVYRTIADSNCSALMVESLPQFIDARTVAEVKSYLRNKELIVAIGLQSSNDFVRNVCINTVCTKEQFERASRLLWQNGYIPRVYLMLKPPFLTEREAIEDAIASIKYAANLGYKSVSISPMRISPYTVVHELTKLGMYNPPYLWSVVETVKRAKLENPSTGIWISYLDNNGKDTDTIYPNNCSVCTPQINEALKIFNVEQDVSVLSSIHCSCEISFQRKLDIEEERKLPERVLAFLSAYENISQEFDS